MNQSFLKWLVVFVIVALILSLGVYFIFKSKSFFSQAPLIKVQTYVFSKLSGIRKVSEEFKNWKHLASENEKLRSDNSVLLSRLAQEDSIKDENDFLRKTLDLAAAKGKVVTEAGIYSFSLGPNGYNLLINKGSEDGVNTDDIVVTEEGYLVGKVRSLGGVFSGIFFVADPNFKINVKILGSDTAGIAKGDLAGHMLLDLIVQDEDIKDGDVVISNGDDLFPAGLVVGRVSHVEINESQIFKKVFLDSAVGEGFLGKVLILHK